MDRQGQGKSKVIIAIVAVIAVLLISIAVAVFIFLGRQQPVPDNDNVNENVPVNIVENNENEGDDQQGTTFNDLSSEDGTETGVYDNGDIPVNNEAVPANNEEYQGDPFEGITEEDHPKVERANPADLAPSNLTPTLNDPAGGSDKGEKIDAPRLNGMDQEGARETAYNLMTTMFNYTNATINTPEYATNLIGYLAPNYSKTGDLAKYADETWRASVSTYPKLYSVVTDVKVETPYVSHNGDHDNMRAVNVTIVVDCNQGQPGEYAWEMVNTYKKSYGVFFNDDNKVVDVMFQYEDIINSNIFQDQAPITQTIPERNGIE